MAQKQNAVGGSVALSGAMSNGTGAMKKKIRDIKRLLSKEDLPSGMRVANERALKTLELNLNDHASTKKMKKMQKKYHMVRFFERKKAIRRYKKAKNELAISEKRSHDEDVDEEEMKELRKTLKKQRRLLHHASVDFAYVLNFPTNIKYISLYTISPVDPKMNEKMKKGITLTNEKREEFKKQYTTELLGESLKITIEEGLLGKNTKNFKPSEGNDDQKIDEIDHVESKNDAKNGDKEDAEDDFFE